MANNLSVSINELLYGEKLPQEIIAEVADNNLNFVCSDVARIKVTNKKRTVLLVAALVVFGALSLIAGISVFSNLFDNIMGSENCIVSKDYSYITYYGEKYVPLDMKGLYCELGERLMDEVRVEEKDFLTKLMFQDALVGVKGSDNDDIIYLQTEFDENPSDYYVKESKLTDVQEAIDNFEAKRYFAIIQQDDGREKKLELSEEYTSMMESLKTSSIDKNQSCFESSDISISVVVGDDGIFLKNIGELILREDKYYWYNYGNEPYPDSVASKKNPYIINKKYYNLIDMIFSYQNQ